MGWNVFWMGHCFRWLLIREVSINISGWRTNISYYYIRLMLKYKGIDFYSTNLLRTVKATPTAFVPNKFPTLATFARTRSAEGCLSTPAPRPQGFDLCLPSVNASWTWEAEGRWQCTGRGEGKQAKPWPTISGDDVWTRAVVHGWAEGKVWRRSRAGEKVGFKGTEF